MSKILRNARIVSNARTACNVADFKNQLGSLNPQAVQTLRWNIDTTKSKGATLVDGSGQKFLDAFMQISSIPLGYDNEELKDAVKQEDVIQMIVSRSSMGLFPPANLPDLLAKPLEIKPPGMDHIQTLMCGSCTIENALKSAFGYQAYKDRGGDGPSELELSSCMDGLQPGTSHRVAMGFRGCFHGRTFGSLSITNSKSAIKVDMPAFEWPHAPFPNLKYPLNENELENEIEERRCLEETEDLLDTWKKSGRPIAAIIVEPIQGEGGDRAATDDFFNKLGGLCKKYNTCFIIDEVQTGFGATGKWWASEYWDVEGDILCYAKKSQACGFYYNKKFAFNPNTRIFNTWMGEPLKLVLMNKVIDIVRRDQLLDNVNHVGNILHQGFLEMSKETDGMVNSARGRGLFRSFNMDSSKNRDALVQKAFDNKLLIGACGEAGIRFRPSLNFTEQEAEKTLEILMKSVRELHG
jgi:4-aminobutyrate aminotransferase/(S)-3-amino-2-methylpropionate transaminase